MRPALLQQLWRQVQRLQLLQALRAKFLKPIQQFGQTLTSGLFEHDEAVERFESSTLALFKDDPGTRNPIGLLPMNQVTYNIERTPGLRAFVRMKPRFRDVAQQRIQCG